MQVERSSASVRRRRLPATLADRACKVGNRFSFRVTCGRDSRYSISASVWGRTTQFLLPAAQRYVGVDISPSMLEAARSAYPNADFRLADASDLGQFADQSFDAIVFSFNGLGCVYPDTSRVKCLAECSRVLKSGGVFIFSLHNASSIFVRPGRRGPGPVGALRGAVAGVMDNAARFLTRVLSTTFWRGRGWYTTSAHGGIKVFAATPSLVVKEVEGLGFTYVEHVAENHPRPPRSLVTRWYYYAFIRR